MLSGRVAYGFPRNGSLADDDVPGLDRFDGPAGGVDFHEARTDRRDDFLSGLQRSDESWHGAPAWCFFCVVSTMQSDLVERHQLSEGRLNMDSGNRCPPCRTRRSSRRDGINGVESCRARNGCSRGSFACCSRRPPSENIFRQFNGFHKIVTKSFQACLR